MIKYSVEKNGTRYEVRTAGNSVRLYTNGVFHTQWNPNFPITGSIWDLLALPALQHSPPQNILVLGVGGGAVFNQLSYFLPKPSMLGIDIDPQHLLIAKKYFGLKSLKNIQLICDDAIAWVNRSKGKEKHKKLQKFDVVIDDLFGEVQGVASRAIAYKKPWAESISKLVKKDGVLIVNFESQQAYRGNYFLSKEGKKAFKFSQTWWQSGYENRIGVFGNTDLSNFVAKDMLRAVEEKVGKSVMRRFNGKFRINNF